MKQLNTRMARPEDAPQILEWLQANPANEFDPGILSYPTLQVLCSYNAEPVCYLPTQKALILESTAIRPGLSELDSAQALRDLVKAAQLLASQSGLREVYYFGTDPRLNAMAERHNFTLRRGWKVLQMRLG